MEITIAILGSGALSALIAGIFGLIQSRHEEKNKNKELIEELESIKSALKLNEKDALRTQLMVMIKDYPNETSDILRLAEHYFKTLKGNWVLTDIFSRWAAENKIVVPNWINTGGNDEQ